ncbi:MAG: aconitate hydratase [Verrucomicrobiae bacterium]|nr:aconitate hydratase [Verrucomicrobiae bacterium]
MKHPFNVLRDFEITSSQKGFFYSLPELEKQGVGPIARLPFSIRVVLESVLRNCDGHKITQEDVKRLANWNAKKPVEEEIPFVVARIVLQDFTGVPLLVDLAAMRSAIKRLGGKPSSVEPLVPVDLVVDHSVQVDYYGRADAMSLNLEMEFQRNRERYEFLKWGQQAFKTFGIVPPGIGIVHQVNLECLAQGVLHAETAQGKIYYPDTLVGTDSHTTMINGLGIVGWGVGGIEAEAGMLGQPVYFLTPEVVGVHMTDELSEGVTATDLALHVTQMLRAAKVVGKFVEFYGEGAAKLSLPDRGTIANMAPEYGATIAIFPVDDESMAYMKATGRTAEQCAAFENYFKAQGLFGMPQKGQLDYSVNLELDLGSIQPSIAGPKRPQDRINLSDVQKTFSTLLEKSAAEGGYGIDKNHLDAKAHIASRRKLSSDEQEMVDDRPTPDLPQQMPESPFHDMSSSMRNLSKLAEADGVQGAGGAQRLSVSSILDGASTDATQQSAASVEFSKSSLGHGAVLIAAITSCTNTSNPSVMVAAGLLAKKAVELGLSIDSSVKTSLAPGSRVVTSYLEKTGLQPYLDKLGFQTVAYGCTTCIGNSGPLQPEIEKAIQDHNLVTAAVLSGNRNFEARIHPAIKANFLMSPPLVVAFALAGRVSIDFAKDPIGLDQNKKPIFLKDIWPSLAEIKTALKNALTPETFLKYYSDFAGQNPKWNEIPSSTGETYSWNDKSTYIQEPPFFENFESKPSSIKSIEGARTLAIFGDSVTTDHISPAGAIKKQSPAGVYLMEQGVKPEDFNSYGSRRGNDRVMTRGTFANVRIKNLMLPGVEGGETLHQPDGERMSIFDAAQRYAQEKTPLLIIAGQEYGTGSSRDWAAKGTQLLGVRAVVASSYERIHRSNLVGMGVLPLQFMEDTNAQTLQLDGTERYDVLGLSEKLEPRQDLKLRITRKDGPSEEIPVKVRIDTAIEIDYYKHGGILPYILRQLVAQNREK